MEDHTGGGVEGLEEGIDGVRRRNGIGEVVERVADMEPVQNCFFVWNGFLKISVRGVAFKPLYLTTTWGIVEKSFNLSKLETIEA